MPFGGLLTVGLIGAGAGLGSAAIASHAAGKAADQQSEAADKALAFEREQYQQQRADTAPWRNAGGQAVQTLSGLMGLPQGPVATSTIGPPPGYTPNQYGVGFGILKPGYTPEQALQMNPGPPAGLPMGARNAPPGVPNPTAQYRSGYDGGGTVQMRAPNGQVQGVPQSQVAHYEQLGAVRV